MHRPPPRPLSSPLTTHTTTTHTAAAYSVPTRLSFTPTHGGGGSAALAAPPSGGKLAMSHLASPTPTQNMSSPSKVFSSVSAVSHPSGGGSTLVWSPSRGSSLSVKSPSRGANLTRMRSPPPPAPAIVQNRNINAIDQTNIVQLQHEPNTTRTHTTTTSFTTSSSETMRSPPRQTLRSPTRAVANGTTRTASAPVSSLLDSMSELRSLIAKKEMELSSLAASRSSASLSSASASFAATIPAAHQLEPRLQSPPRRAMSPPPSAIVDSFHATAANLIAAQSQASEAITAHTQSLHDQEIHEYNIRVMSLEQALLEREEQYQSLKLDVDRLRRREETLAADNDVRAVAHKKQVEILNSSLESLTWNRHESLEKQREEFERLRKEMMEEMLKKDEIHNLKLTNLNQNLLQYEEALRASRNEIDDIRDKSKKDVDQLSAQVSSLTLEVSSLQSQKSSVKDQLQSGVKQQLTMSNNIKTLSRRLEETQKAQERERAEFFTQKSKLDAETLRIRTELESRAEETIEQLRAVERQLLENERNHASALAQSDREKDDLRIQAQQDREALLEESHELKRAMLEEFQQKVNESALALTAAQNHASRLERDLQEQRQRMQHEHELAAESWNNLVQEKERELQQARRETQTCQTQFHQSKEHTIELDATITELKLELVQTQSDLQHARASLDESVERLGEVRAQHKSLEDERAQSYHAQLEDLQQRLIDSQRSGDEASRALQVERLRTSELTSQLQLLRTSSTNKARAIEVARSLEQQALLTDFASQLGRVRNEINAIKTQTPKDKQREWNRTKRERERERQSTERTESRERSRERMRSPQPQSVASLGGMSSPGSLIGSARRHVRVRSIDDAPLHAQGFGSPR